MADQQNGIIETGLVRKLGVADAASAAELRYRQRVAVVSSVVGVAARQQQADIAALPTVSETDIVSSDRSTARENYLRKVNRHHADMTTATADTRDCYALIEAGNQARSDAKKRLGSILDANPEVFERAGVARDDFCENVSVVRTARVSERFSVVDMRSIQTKVMESTSKSIRVQSVGDGGTGETEQSYTRQATRQSVSASRTARSDYDASQRDDYSNDGGCDVEYMHQSQEMEESSSRSFGKYRRGGHEGAAAECGIGFKQDSQARRSFRTHQENTGDGFDFAQDSRESFAQSISCGGRSARDPIQSSARRGSWEEACHEVDDEPEPTREVGRSSGFRDSSALTRAVCDSSSSLRPMSEASRVARYPSVCDSAAPFQASGGYGGDRSVQRSIQDVGVSRVTQLPRAYATSRISTPQVLDRQPAPVRETLSFKGTFGDDIYRTYAVPIPLCRVQSILQPAQKHPQIAGSLSQTSRPQLQCALQVGVVHSSQSRAVNPVNSSSQAHGGLVRQITTPCAGFSGVINTIFKTIEQNYRHDPHGESDMDVISALSHYFAFDGLPETNTDLWNETRSIAGHYVE